MTLQVSLLQQDTGEHNFYSKAFRDLFENHIVFLQNDNSTDLIEITNHQKIKYVGDFYGILIDSNIPQDLHWFCLRLSGLHNPIDYSDSLQYILIPNRNKLTLLLGKLLHTSITN